MKSRVSLQRARSVLVHESHYSRLEKPTIYTVCHPRKTATYILHVVPITAHTHDRRKSTEKKKQRTIIKIKERKEKKRHKSGKTKRKIYKRKDNTIGEKARKGK